MHHWQDFVFTAGNIVFALSLIPSIRSPHKPALGTSIPTAAVLGAFAVCYATLNLWFSTFTAIVIGILWGVLAWQRRRQDGDAKGPS